MMKQRIFGVLCALFLLGTACKKESEVTVAVDEEIISVVGVWGVENRASFSYLTLLSNNTFLYAENDTTANGSEENGVEVGTYLYNSVNQNITFTIVYDDNDPGNDSGIGDMGTTVTLNARLMEEKSKLSLADGALILTKLDVNYPAIVGVWSFHNGAAFSYLTLLSNNTFLYAENDLSVNSPAENGLEVGTYVHDLDNQEITFDIAYDDNAPGEDSGVGDIGTATTTSAVLSNGNNTLTIANLILTKTL